MRFDSQVYPHNEPGGYENCISSSVSFSSVDGTGFSSCPVEREPYIPKVLEVNYIEGFNDKRWSSNNFPWTKKMEVLIYIILIFIFALPALIILKCCLTATTFRPITKKCLEITLSVSTKERSLMLR